MNKEELDRHRRLLIEKVKELKQENKHLNLQLDQALKDYEDLLIKIDKAIEYIKNNIDNTGWLEIGSSNVNELLEILGDKENEET